jgi:hypothetical protein
MYCCIAARSRAKFCKVFVLFQRVGIGECFLVFDGPAVNDIAHCKFDDLAGFGSRNIRYLYDLGGDMAGRRAIADTGTYCLGKILIERQPIGEPDEQHDAHIIVPILADTDGF